MDRQKLSVLVSHWLPKVMDKLCSWSEMASMLLDSRILTLLPRLTQCEASTGEEILKLFPESDGCLDVVCTGQKAS